jgi:hypothetical protein
MASGMGSKKALMLLGIVFIVPVILAKIALEQDWFNRGVTNKGQLLTPVIDASSLLAEAPKKWRVLYVVPETCTESCQQAVYSIQQIDVALGKESDRANATLLVTAQSDQTALTLLQSETSAEVLQVSNKNVNEVFKSDLRNGIFLVDTLNNAMMRYDLPEQREVAIMQSRDVLSDLKKMLKLSRIG